MSDHQNRHDRRGTEPESDRQLEQRLRSWLDSEPDRPAETLAPAAIVRARATAQRPAWAARLIRGDGGPHTTLVRLGAGAATVAVAVLVAAIAWRAVAPPINNGASAPPTTTAPTVAAASSAPSASAATPFDGRAQAVLHLEHRATALGSGFGALWVGDDAGNLLRVDPVGGAIVATIELGAVPCGPILAASTSIWLTTCGQGAASDAAVTVRVDPGTNSVANTYADAGGDGIGISAMNGLVWFVSDVERGTLTAVDATTGVHVRDLSLGAGIRHLTAGLGSLWVSPIGRPDVLRIDPENGRELARVALSGDAGYLLATADAIWVAEPHQWLVGRIDPVTDRLGAESGAPVGVGHLEIAESGLVWALGDTRAVAIAPTDYAIADAFAVPAHLAGDGVGTHVLVTFGGSAWFADGAELLRIDPR